MRQMGHLVLLAEEFQWLLVFLAKPLAGQQGGGLQLEPLGHFHDVAQLSVAPLARPPAALGRYSQLPSGPSTG